uniref:Uncharacterized protein n=1 Tax=Rhizophora mucronata TaxID=61149 RepID=A0A2P2JK87_RHIMU
MCKPKPDIHGLIIFPNSRIKDSTCLNKNLKFNTKHLQESSAVLSILFFFFNFGFTVLSNSKDATSICVLR